MEVETKAVKNHIPEILEYPISAFSNHLSYVNNNRIIFSGAFGTGKTTFLKHYFDERTQEQKLLNKKYIPLYLYPVRYTVGSNEDILKYIKYDILCELVRQGVPFDDTRIDYLQSLPEFLKKNATDLLSKFLYMVPKVGGSLVEIYDKADAYIKKYLKYHDELNAQADAALVEAFLTDVENLDGSIYEDDIINKIIEDSIRILSKKGNVVLIIDDLDRIDPAHIFRLFNIFAAHFDAEDDLPNKFGIAKIIFVCDINNIRNIFRHIYGTRTDFNGYIDKFFSKEVFYFDNKEIIEQVLNKILWSIEVRNNDQKAKDLFIGICRSKELIFTLRHMIYAGAISMRALFKYYKEPIDLANRELAPNRAKGATYETLQFHALVQLEFLVKFFGDVNHLQEAVAKCKRKITINDDTNSIAIGNFVILMGLEEGKIHSNSEYRYDLQVGNETRVIHYKVEMGAHAFLGNVVKIEKRFREQSISSHLENNFKYFDLLEKAILFLRKVDYY